MSEVKAPRHLTLDFLRGIAAIGVMTYHWLAWRYDLHVQSLGSFSVYLFFTLSALVMSLTYGRMFGTIITRDSVGAFARNRAARLVPMLALTTVATLVLLLVQSDFAQIGKLADEALLTGSGFMALAAPGYASMISGGWSLGIEISFYGIAPIAILTTSGMRVKSLLCAFIALALAQQVWVYSIASILDPARHWELYSLPITFAPFFAAGILIAQGRAERQSYFIWPSLLCLVMFMSLSLFWQGDLQRSNGFFLIAMGLSIGAVYFAYRARLPRALGGAAKILGDISYGLYLLHPVMFTFNSLAARHLGFGPLVRNLLDFAAVFIAAFVCFHLFERPLRNRLRGGAVKIRVSAFP